MKLHPAVLWFSVLALAFTVTTYLRDPILSAIASLPTGTADVQTISSFDSLNQDPVVVQAVAPQANHRIKLDLRFRPTALDGYPNIIQTADVNSGVRLELHDHVLSVVYPGRTGLAGELLSDDIQIGRWYDVSIEYQNYGFLRASCSDGKSVHITSIADAQTEHVMVGRGFTDERRFHGQIEGFSIQTTSRVGMGAAEWVFFSGKLLLLLGGAAAFWRMSRCDVPAPEPIGRIEAPATGPIDALLTLRAFALVQVLVGHLFLSVFAPDQFPAKLADSPWLRLLAPCPWAGVWVFFTLSGYLMGKGFYTGRYTLAPRRVSHYLSNRLLRVVPVYVGVVLLVSVAFCPLIFNPKHLAVLGSILIFDYNGQQRLNPIGALWSVTAEMQFYALVPILFYGLSTAVGPHHQRAIKISGLVLVAGLGARVICKELVGREGTAVFIYTPTLGNLDLFALGMLANSWLPELRSKAWIARRATIPNALALIAGGYLLSSFIGSAVLTGDVDRSRVMIYGPTLVAPLTLMIIACCELGSASQARAGIGRLTLQTGGAIGVLAYAIYVVHEPVLLELRKVVPASLSVGASLKYALFATFLTWAVAELIYRYIELPTERLKRKKQLATHETEQDNSAPPTLPFAKIADTGSKSKAA